MKIMTLLVALLVLAVASPAVWAGGGPETTLVVVNADSPTSRRIANEYAALRDIPRENLLHLTGIPHQGSITLDFFLEKIWTPIEEHLRSRGRTDDIDLIAYSTGFPYAVNFRSRLDKGKGGQAVGSQAALTGVTYLARHVLAGDAFWNLQINRYYRLQFGARNLMPPNLAGEQAKLQRKAREAHADKRYADAVKLYEELLALNDTPQNEWYDYACSLARAGRADDALVALDTAAEKGFFNAAHASRDPDLESLRSRPQFRRILGKIEEVARSRNTVKLLQSRGFRSTYAWPEGSGAAVDRYWLSVQLGYTGFRGNSVPEILHYLKSAAESDGTRPDGTVYLCKNKDVRSTSRELFFPMLVEAMKKLGRKVEILAAGDGKQTGILPIEKDDVIGAVVGRAGFKWFSSKSRMLPGAIVEHLTSFGAHFGTPGQTKLTEFLRYGAAGASGTVQEPLAIHLKFPNPLIHMFYADGCSLAEAFYQSVAGPYQLMIVGDGLARPFADFVPVKANLPPGPWKGTVTFRPKARAAKFELWVNGRRRSEGDELTLDTTKLDDGHHEVRVVAVGKPPIETRSFVRHDVVVDNHGLGGTVVVRSGPEVPLGTPVELDVKGTAEVRILEGNRVVFTGKPGRIKVPTDRLGPGPVVLVPLLVSEAGTALRAAPVRVRIALPKPTAGQLKDIPKKPGLRGAVTGKDGERPVVISGLGTRQEGPQLQDFPAVKGAKRITLAGEFMVEADGWYEVMATGSGKLGITLDGKVRGKDLDLATMRSFAFPATKGWHAIALDFAPKGAPKLVLRMCGEAAPVTLRFRHGSLPAHAKTPVMAGAKEGKPITVPPEGLVLDFKRTTKNIAGFTLTPVAAAKVFPTDWVVEFNTGGKKWKPVKDIRTAVGREPKKRPSFVEIVFPPIKAKKIRIRAKDRKPVVLGSLVVLGKK